MLAQKTQLENQILGSFPRLEPELVLASAVRANGEVDRGARPLRAETTQALMDREFHREEIEEHKRRHVVGEGKDGQLVLLERPAAPEAARRLEELVERENRARAVIVQRVIQVHADLSQRDLPLVRSIFSRMTIQASPPGTRFQDDEGRWQTLPKRPGRRASER